VAPRRFGQFYLNDSLSDFTLIDGDTGKRHNVHRVVLASASGLINRFLSVKSPADMQNAIVENARRLGLSAEGPLGIGQGLLRGAGNYGMGFGELAKKTALLNQATAGYEFTTPRRYVRMKIAEEENIVFEQIVLRFIYDNQNFERVKPLITSQRVAAVLDLAQLLEIDLLFQMTFVHLCEHLLNQACLLPHFDHGFLEHLFNSIDNKGSPWQELNGQLQDALAARFEDLLHFNEVEHLPARVFSLVLQSDNLHVDEEQQVITLV